MNLLLKSFRQGIATTAAPGELEVQRMSADDQTRSQGRGHGLTRDVLPLDTAPQKQAQNSRAEQRQAGNSAVFLPVRGHQGNRAHRGGPEQEQWLKLLRDVDQGR